MDTSGWRNQMQPGTRQLLFNQILDALKIHNSTRDESFKLLKIAQSIEKRTYDGATSEADYFHKIGLRALALRSKF